MQIVASLYIFELVGIVRLAFFSGVLYAVGRFQRSYVMLLTFGLLAPGFFLQWGIEGSEGAQAQFLGADCAVAYALGTFLRLRNTDRRLEFPIIFLLIILTQAFSSFQAIAYNLLASMSEFRLRGLLYNLLFFHKGSWFSDYGPALKNLYLFGSLSLMAGFIAIDVALKKFHYRELWWLVEKLGFLIISLAFLQKYFQLGYDIFGFRKGIHGLLPDPHAFATFAYLIFSIALFNLLTRSESFVKNAIFFIMSLLAIFLSQSKYVMLLSLLTVPTFILFLAGKRVQSYQTGKLVALVLCSLGILAVFSGPLAQRFRYLLDHRSMPGLNLFLTFRPEIYQQAWHVFSEFPVSGLGSGNFFWTSSLPDFSSSPFLRYRGGENVHSFLLQVLAEQGAAGLAVWLLLLGMLIREAFTKGTRFGGAVLALAIAFGGNVMGHSLLTGENALLFFLASGFALSRTYKSHQRQSHLLALVLGSFVVLSSAFSIVTFDKKVPFGTGAKCFVDQYWPDGQVSGAAHLELVPKTSAPLELQFRAHHPKLTKTKLVSQIRLTGPKGEVLYDQQLVFSDHDVKEVFLPVAKKGEKHLLEIRTDRCFTAMNWGISLDERPTAVQIVNLGELAKQKIL